MTLTRAEKLEALNTWQTAVRDRLNPLVDSTDGILEVDFWSPVFEMSTLYTSAVSKLVGDFGGWLEWYHHTADFGRSDINNVYVHGVATPVNTVDVLLDMIEKI